MRRALALLLVAAISGCGASPVPAASPPARPVSLAAATGLIPPAALAGLVATTSAPVTIPIGTPDVAKDSSAPGLAARLTGWGYQGGWQRTYQGESRHLTLVTSRSLLFSAPRGASAFVSYLRRELPFFYKYALIMKRVAGGRVIWVIDPPACACHMATPLVAGVVASGDQVSWLEINGPDASPDLLVALLNGRSVS